MVEIVKLDKKVPENVEKIFKGKHFFAEEQRRMGAKCYFISLADFLEKLSTREVEEIEKFIDEISDREKFRGFVFSGDEAIEVFSEERRA
jgi:hypothetical protein